MIASARVETRATPPVEESPSFLPHHGSQLYVVHHPAAGPCRAAVVLVGPMALERTHAYLTWVRWARHLARAGFDALRFDFRGVGESTRPFSEVGLADWEEDVDTATAFLARMRPGVPLILHGLRLGGLLAARAFERGQGDALLLWEPVTSARQHLLEVLRRKVTADNMERVSPPQTRDHCAEVLEQGGIVEVEGYPWSGKLWRSSLDCDVTLTPTAGRRPMHLVHLDGRPPERWLVPGCSSSVRVPRPSFWGEARELKAPVTELFEESTAWLAGPALRRGMP